LVGHSETRDVDALVLRVSNPVASGLKLSRRDNQIACHTDDGKMTGINLKMSDVAYYLGASYFYMPVIDETGLSKAYDFDFHWDASLEEDALKKEIQRALSEQLGLELVPARRPIEMLVVEKANK
jgi:uncharacterized protein (TIGR03435 family)